MIEIMVVAAIIGVLITIALPKMWAYRARTAQAEVKAQMSALRNSLESRLSEDGWYTDNILSTGYVPTGNPRYIYGFTSDNQPAASGINDTAELAAYVSGYGTTNMLNGVGAPLTVAELPSAVVTAKTYTIGAAGNLDIDGVIDTWTLDKEDGFSNVTNDVD